MIQALVTNKGTTLELRGADKFIFRYHAIWLRDNAWDEETRSPDNGQRLITINQLPENLMIENAEIQGDHIEICFQPENKTVSYDLDWLLVNAYDKKGGPKKPWTNDKIKTWDRSLAVPVGDFHALKLSDSDKALHAWLQDTVTYGFAKLENGPIQDQALMEVINLFGYVRETNYGRHFEVRTEVNPTNLAFTGLGLQAHTDNPYRDPVPTLQLLYCLESSAAGGENMVVDGFRVVERLQDENPEWTRVLSQYDARFEYGGDLDVLLRAKRPMIELGPDQELRAVRFNNRSSATLTDVPFDEMALYYEAYRRMAELVDDLDMQVEFRLEPGDCFLVDNTRVLHARRGYAGTGKRWLQGCYADKDSLLSKFSVLDAQAKAGLLR